jgi:predicted nucleic acid-binding protein
LISFDTDVLVYAADRQAGMRHSIANQIIAMAIGKNTVAVTDQSLIEFLNATTVRGKLSLADATTTLRGYLTYFELMLPPLSVVEDTLTLLARHRLSVWDARILAVCDKHGCTHLLSEDMQDGAQYGGVTVVNPFNPANMAVVTQLLIP